jgi:hypothetical protein
MNIRTLRGCAVLACFACALSARAVVLTIHQATNSYLDITLDVSAGHWVNEGILGSMYWYQDTPSSVSAQIWGWTMGGNVLSDPPTFGGDFFIRRPGGGTFLFYTADLGVSFSNGVPFPNFTVGNGERVLPAVPPWEGSIPVVSKLSNTVTRIVWDAPDGGNTLPLFAAVLGSLFLIHRTSRRSRAHRARLPNE